MELRDVEPGDVDAYARMRCDPAMMAELGGPLPREGIAAKVQTDVQKTRADEYWVSMIVPDETKPATVAGTVSLWSHQDVDEAGLSEIGWMVLPEYQGRGLAKRAVRALLERARDDGRWGVVHAFPVSPMPRPTRCAEPSASPSSANATSRSPLGCSTPTTGGSTRAPTSPR